MTLKTLVTGVAAVAAVGGAAVGVTSLASSTITAAPAVQPVVWDIPMPLAPEDDLVGPLTQTVNTLGSGGSFPASRPTSRASAGSQVRASS